jgi:hypothetical protein
VYQASGALLDRADGAFDLGNVIIGVCDVDGRG